MSARGQQRPFTGQHRALSQRATRCEVRLIDVDRSFPDRVSNDATRPCVQRPIPGLPRSPTGRSPFASSSKKIPREREFFEKTWTFRDAGKGKTETLKADNYEFPFDMVLEGSLPESIEGLPDTFVIYRFKAVIRRKHAKDVIARKPLRIIRTLDSNALEPAHAMTVSNVWPNKLDYAISTPSKAVIYGTSIEAEFRLVPLLKGLKIGSITTQVIEIQDFAIEVDNLASLSHCHRLTRVVAEDGYELTEDPEILDEEAEGYRFSRHIELPKSLTRCLQDAEARGIKIRHKLKFNIQLLNPDEHTSELRATLPVSFYISPSLALNENNELIDRSPNAARRAIETEIAHQAPPVYGDHELDQLYSEVNCSGYSTPATSSVGTPASTLSRNISSENVAYPDPSSVGGAPPTVNSSRPIDLSAATLRSRLQSLRSQPASLMNENNSSNSNGHDISPRLSRQSSGRNPRFASDQSSINHSPRRSHSANSCYRSGSITPRRDRSHSLRRLPGVFRSASNGGRIPALGSSSDTQTPSGEPQYLEVENLSRVPSYSLAVRSLARTPYSGPDLPSYVDATAIAMMAASPNADHGSNPGFSLPSLTGPAQGVVERGRVAADPSTILEQAGSTFSTREQRLSRLASEVQDDERRMRPVQVR